MIPFSNAVSPDGQWIAAVNAQGAIVRVDVNTGRDVAVASEPNEVPMRWSDDGRALFVYSKNQLPLRITLLVPPRQLVVAGPFVADLAWTSKPSRKYAIETNTTLLATWNVAASGIIPSAGATTAVQFTDVQAGQRFYRVQGKLPLAP